MGRLDILGCRAERSRAPRWQVSGIIDIVRLTPKLVAAFACIALVLTACGDDGPDQPQTIAQQFADAINNDDPTAAGALTNEPNKATAAIYQMFDGLGKGVTFEVQQASGDNGGTVEFGAQWDLGPDSENPRGWRYTTTAQASDTEQGWRITWNPAVLAPELAEGQTLRYVSVAPTPAKIIADANQELMTQQVVTLVNLDQTVNPAVVAPLLTPIAPGITVASLQSDIGAAQGKPVTAITLREQDVAPIEAVLAGIPGVTLVKQTRLLTTDRSLASPALNGLSDLWQQDSDAAAGWAVEAVRTDGAAQRLIGEDAKPTSDISTTLDLGLQTAAESALAAVPQAAAIVGLQPSTGAVLAVAQNAPADGQGPIALTGLYPPGSTFKPVTVSAALQASGVTPDTVLPCPGTENIEGRQIPNDDNFDLGQVPLHTAFARSCNTTMGRLAVGLPADGLTKAAAQMGLGIDYVTPGLTTVTGNVPRADTPAQRVESGIGQGQVTASPFGMALVVATIARGSVPAPMLVNGQPGTGDRTPEALPANIADQLRTMMRETVTAGTATALNDIPDLRGKTGTAEHGNGAAHGWFVGIDGDLAFAVFVAEAGSSSPAIEAAGRFLRPIQAQIPR